MKIPYLLIVTLCVFFTNHNVLAADNPPKDMVLIPSGCFIMGTNKTYEYEEGRLNEREKPAHQVCLDAFYLDKYEASQKVFKEVMGYNPSLLKNDNWPVDRSRYEEAVEFCRRQGKRLPTEAEWEYAARAGSNTRFPWGDTIDRDYLWYEGNAVRKPHPVGTRKPNAWGLHDMLGNVWEWTSDWYSDHYYQISPKNNPKGPQKRQSWHVIRGGSWTDDAAHLRVTMRYRGLSDPTEHFFLGMRCAKDVNTKK